MSNAFAIAAVTATLRSLIKKAIEADAEFSGADVSTKPPDIARKDMSGDQVNIFLYHTSINSAFSNSPMPGRIKPGESGRPPLPINLQYLIIAYGKDDDDVRAHLLLGIAMLVLHDYNQFAAADLKGVLTSLTGMKPDLYEQIEPVKISPLPLSLEERSKLWATFQTQYRISATYHIEVVLIESKRPVVSPLPVARRTPDDYVDTQDNLLPPFPTLKQVVLAKDASKALDDPRRRTTFVLKDDILISGHHLTGMLELQFEHLRLDAPIIIPIDNSEANNGNDFAVRFTVPDAPNVWLPGVYGLSILVKDNDPPRTSNTIPFLVAPSMTITLTPPLMLDANGFPALALPAGGDLTLEITVKPDILSSSRVVLLMEGREIQSSTIPAPLPQPAIRLQKVAFALTNLQRKPYPLRLRVDGVDSFLIDLDQATPGYRPDQHLKVT